MTDFQQSDVEIRHWRLADGSGELQIIHTPSGVSVQATLKTEPVLKVKERLMRELARKLSEAGK
jgi:hypothetical protein